MISAVVVTYNSETKIEKTLLSLKEALAGFTSEIIVVDNASSDKSLELVEKTNVADRIVRSRINAGFAAGVNRGLSVARGSYMLLVNPDLLITEECVSGMLCFLRANASVGAVGPKLLYPNGEIQPSRRRYPTLRGLLSSKIPLVTKIIGPSHLKDYWMLDTKFDTPTDVDWIIAACIMITATCLHHVGEFDDEFFLYLEDTDWCIRAGKKKYRICYLPNVSAIHYYRKESSTISSKAFLYHLASSLRFVRKHGLAI